MAFLLATEQRPGYIVSEPVETPSTSSSASTISPSIALGADQTRYTDFLPMLFRQFALHAHLKEFADFDSAVDEYYSKLYAQRVASEQVEHEATVDKRLDKVRGSREKWGIP